MANGNGQGVSSIRAFKISTRQKAFDHILNLLLARVTDANNRLFDMVGGVFRYRNPQLPRHQQGNRPGMTKLQGGHGIFVHESMFDSHLVRCPLFHHGS